MAERYQRNTPYQAPGADFSAADTAQQLSTALAHFSRRGAQEYGQIRARQGAEAGAAAGAGVTDASQLKKKSAFTLYGESYNQTMMQGHQAAIESDIQQNLQKFADENENNLEGYQQAVAGYKKGVTGSVLPEFQAHADQLITQYSGSAERHIRKRAQDLAVKEAHGQLAQGWEALKQLGAQQARDGDIEGMTDTAERARQLVEANTLSPENPTGYFDPTRTAQLLAGLKDDADENLLVGQIDRTVPMEGLEAIAQQLRTGKVKDLGISPEVKDKALAHVERSIVKRKAEAEAGNAEARAVLQDQVRDDIAQYEDGIVVKNPVRMSDFVLVYGDKGVALFAEYEKKRELGKDISVLRGMPKTDIADLIGARGPVAGLGYADAKARQKSLIDASENVLAMREEDAANYIISTSQSAATALAGMQNDVPGSGAAYFRAVNAERARLQIQSTEIMPPGVPFGSAEWQTVGVLAAKAYTMLPKEAAKWADTAVRSTDPLTASKAARFLANAEGAQANSTSNVSQDARTDAMQLNRLLDTGTPSDKALETMEKSRDVPDEVRQVRKAKYAKTFLPQNAGALDNYIDKDLDKRAFARQPSITPEMQAEFNNRVLTEFVARGDIELARDRAWLDMKNLYTPSRVNGGNQMLLLPPERFHVKPEEVRAEIAELVAKYPQPDGSTAEEIVLVPTSKTIRQVESILNGEQITPSYRLVTKSGDDFIVDGIRMEYSLPPLDETVKKRLAERDAYDEEKITEAKAHRDEIKRQEADARARNIARGLVQ